ncbi:MAG: hypothetical protein K2K63_17090 [Acetatifactor sp.]|nr:hypothetical protein [Acetatifactor sp.]
MHKKMKLFVSMLAAAAMLVLLPGGNAMTAHAEEAKTYSIKYIGGDINDWRYVPGNTFEDGMYHRELYYLKLNDLKDGDLIVIYPGDEVPNGKELDLSGFRLGNLTVHRDANVVVKTNGIKDCYVLAGAYAAINGDVTNAHLYDSVTCNFNNNVLDMVLHVSGDAKSSIACTGTVGMFQVLEDSTNNTRCVFYSIPNNTMKFYGGGIQFANCPSEPTEAYLQAKAAAGETTAAPETTPAPAANSSEYDKVPKTGESSQAAWLIGLVGAAAILFAGSYGLYKKTN